MCGICGIALGPESNETITNELVERMRDTLVHRGPDDAGTYVAPGVGLGHRRLSIVDVAGGHQPVHGKDGRYVLVYNGEVYNHETLRADLEAKGAEYRTRSDTETVLNMFAEYGSRAPEQLQGMFAFAIWDTDTRSLFLCRDRIGIKPLYYAHLSDGSLIFGSEIKALLEAPGVRANLNTSALPELFATRAPMGEETLFEGILRLPPAHTLRWKDGKIEIARYWSLEFKPDEASTKSDADWTNEFRDRFFESVKSRLMADVPLGMFLSGGIDSAAITAAMSTLVTEPIKTFSVAFNEREANEFVYARMVAERYKTDHHEVLVSPEQFFGALPKLIWHEDEPIAHPSSIPLHFVSKLAAEHVKVVLTGEGSDENLAGYPWYRATLYMNRYGERYESLVPAPIRGLIRKAVLGGPLPKNLRRKLRRTPLVISSDLDTLLYDNFGVFGRAMQQEMLEPEVLDAVRGIDPYGSIHRVFNESSATTLLNKMLDVDQRTYIHELLMKQDQMSMSASLESRVPFLDHGLVEFMATLPQRMKLRGLTTKAVLRYAMKEWLPPEIISRKKMGFPVPIGPWFRGPYQNMVDEFVLSPRARERGVFKRDFIDRIIREHQSGEIKHGERIWSMVNFEIWHRIFIDGQAPEEITTPVASTEPVAVGA